MAIANLHETLLTYTLRKEALTVEINQLQAQKQLAVYSQGDISRLKCEDEEEVRRYYRELYEGNDDYQGKYKDYTQIPDFEEEMNKIQANYQEQLEQLNAWETTLDNQILTNSAELEEVKAYMESIKSMLSSNIQEDFNYGLK